MKLKVITAGITASLIALSLAGCSSGPSEGDIGKVVKAEIEKSNHQFDNIAGGMMKGKMQTELHSVKKIGCKEAEGSPGYNCDVEIDATAPMVGRHKETAKIRFVKGDDGWKITQ